MDRSMKSATDEVLDTTAAINKGILVAVRIRPLSSKELESGAQACCESLGHSNVVTISQAGVVGSYLKSQAGTVNEYAFDSVFDSSASQMEVYRRTAKPFIPRVLAGFNVTVFAYGATSAGKTHTMFGSSRADEAASRAEAGIIPNAIGDLFHYIEEKMDVLSTGEKWEVNMSYIEVYNEQIYDLLVAVPTGKMLSLREDQEKGIVMIAGVIDQKVNALDEVMKLLALGNRNRKTEATMANQVSSRSHAILQLNVTHTFRSSGGKEATVESKLSLIDLAGSERASATNNRGVRLMEGASINKSLLALANCINALAENSGTGKKGNVKFRDSKLTLLLKNSLEGRSNLVIIANVNPSHVTLEDSHNTLKYANRAKNIKINAFIKEGSRDLPWAEREVRLIEENKALRKRVAILENLVDDLRAGLADSGSVVTGREGSTVPWTRARVKNLDLSDDGCVGDEDTAGNRMSNSFSSSISSYSDLMDFDFANEYEAAQASSTSEKFLDQIPDLKTFGVVSVAGSKVLPPGDSEQNSSKSSSLESCWQNVPQISQKAQIQNVKSVVPESPSLKRSRDNAFGGDEDVPREAAINPFSFLTSMGSSKSPFKPTSSKTVTNHTEKLLISEVVVEVISLCGEIRSDVDSVTLKKRRVSSIPMFARTVATTCVTRDSINKAANIKKSDSAETNLRNKNSSGEMKNTSYPTISTAPQFSSSESSSPLSGIESFCVPSSFDESVDLRAKNVAISRGESVRSRRGLSIASKRRSLEIEAVNAMLAALPDQLQSIPKGDGIGSLRRRSRIHTSDVCGLDGEVDSGGSADGALMTRVKVEKGEKEEQRGADDCDSNGSDKENAVDENVAIISCDGNIGTKPALRRQSVRVEQKNAKALSTRLASISEENLISQFEEISDVIQFSSNQMATKNRRNSVIKGELNCSEEDRIPVSNLLDDDVTSMNISMSSDAWLSI